MQASQKSREPDVELVASSHRCYGYLAGPVVSSKVPHPKSQNNADQQIFRRYRLGTIP